LVVLAQSTAEEKSELKQRSLSLEDALTFVYDKKDEAEN